MSKRLNYWLSALVNTFCMLVEDICIFGTILLIGTQSNMFSHLVVLDVCSPIMYYLCPIVSTKIYYCHLDKVEKEGKSI